MERIATTLETFEYTPPYDRDYALISGSRLVEDLEGASNLFLILILRISIARDVYSLFIFSVLLANLCSAATNSVFRSLKVEESPRRMRRAFAYKSSRALVQASTISFTAFS